MIRRSYLGGVVLALITWCGGTALADTLPLSIFISELTDTDPPFVRVTLTPGYCTLTLEHVACVFLYPGGTLGTNLIQGIAALSEAPGEEEGGTGTISDEVRVSVIPGTANDSLMVTFDSDRPGFSFVEGLDAIAIPESADGNVLLGPSTNHFFDTRTLQPAQLPGQITITVVSDAVPEPSTLLLMTTGIALVMAGRAEQLRRRWSQTSVS